MELQIKIKINEKLFLRDPESSDLGRKIIQQGVLMIDEIGYEHFTFKKLASRIGTTEAGIYRYFENKQKLLIYLLVLYWSLIEYLVMYHIHNLSDPVQKIKKTIELLVNEPDTEPGQLLVNESALYRIAISESAKTYLNKEVTENNNALFFKPYKDLCARISTLITEYNPHYPFPKSLSSTMIEAAHFQYFFLKNLPSLTDNQSEEKGNSIQLFIEKLVFSNINP